MRSIFFSIVFFLSVGVFAYAEPVMPLKDAKTLSPSKQGAHLQESFSNTIGQTFVYIKPGSFMMGSPPDELGRSVDETQHRVILSRGFYMQTTEVTQAQWRMIMGTNPSHYVDCGDLCPVESVSWDDVQKFIQFLNLRPGTRRYRLPTEAEWEYAARAGTTGSFAGGSVDSMAWYLDNSDDTVHPVGKKTPNAWGLYDMHGNAREWVHDWYAEYPAGSVTDPKGPPRAYYRINRGGGWNMPSFSCRSADRFINGPGTVSYGMGFRLVVEGSP